MSVNGDEIGRWSIPNAGNLFEVEEGIHKMNIPSTQGRYAKLDVLTNIRNFGEILPRINELGQALHQEPIEGDRLPKKNVYVNYDANQMKIFINNSSNRELLYEINVPHEDRDNFETEDSSEGNDMPGRLHEVELQNIPDSRQEGRLKELSQQVAKLNYEFSTVETPSKQYALKIGANLDKAENLKKEVIGFLKDAERGTDSQVEASALLDVCNMLIRDNTRKFNFIGKDFKLPERVLEQPTGFADQTNTVRIRGNTVDLPEFHHTEQQQEKTAVIYEIASKVFTVDGALKFWGKLDANMEIRHLKGEISTATLVGYELLSGLGARLHVAFAGSLSLVASIIAAVPRLFIAMAVVHQKRTEGEYGKGFKAVAIAAANWFKLGIGENILGIARDTFKTAWFTLMGVPRTLVANNIYSGQEERASVSKYIIIALHHITSRELNFWEARNVLNLELDRSKSQQAG